MILTRQVHDLIKQSLFEDIGSGDITTNTLISHKSTSLAYITAKEPLVLSGLDIAKAVFTAIDPQVSFIPHYKDSQKVQKNQHIATVSGKTIPLLTGERTALNFLQRLSGISTLTKKYVEKLNNLKADVIDTRKTTPGYRKLEKYAVTCGGGKNHRFGLYDMVLIKDNHIKAAGSITKCIAQVRKKVKNTIPIEVEITNLAELEEALASQADRILCDNMTVPELKRAVEITNGRVILEASGGITLDSIEEIGKTGVNLISAGALTHSFRSVDISMNIS